MRKPALPVGPNVFIEEPIHRVAAFHGHGWRHECVLHAGLKFVGGQGAW